MEGMDDGSQILPLTWITNCYMEPLPYVHIFTNLIISNYKLLPLQYSHGLESKSPNPSDRNPSRFQPISGELLSWRANKNDSDRLWRKHRQELMNLPKAPVFAVLGVRILNDCCLKQKNCFKNDGPMFTHKFCLFRIPLDGPCGSQVTLLAISLARLIFCRTCVQKWSHWVLFGGTNLLQHDLFQNAFLSPPLCFQVIKCSLVG